MLKSQAAQTPPFDFSFDQAQQRWVLNNGTITAVFQLSESGIFRLEQAGLTGRTWQTPPARISSPIRFAINGQVFDASTPFVLIEQHTEITTRKGFRQVITLEDAQKSARVVLYLEMFTGQPVLRMRTLVTNLKADTVYITLSDMLPLSFADAGAPFNAFRVNQWAVVPRDLDFQSSQIALRPNGAPVTIQSGAHGLQATWVALRDSKNRGIFAGWEFNGRSAAQVSYPAGDNALQFTAPVDRIHHPVPAGSVYFGPAAFVGFFQGDWEEAGYRTQRFLEASLARAAPDLQRFPYMSWDSWGYQQQFDEKVLRRNAAIAAQLGVELFIVDLGWAKGIGDWYADPAKFPSGLKALSNYVHSLGMKFGLHLTPAEADLQSPILIANPDWTSSEDDNYFNAASLCLSHLPARTWLVSEIVRVIDDYGVDWILQDGENMVKNCEKSTHTHHPDDSNYANSVQGIDYVVEEVLRQRPDVSWENCENGGNMMTFKMVQDYVTSITNDASGALASRQGAYGATYPFSPRFADRYSPEDPVNTYNTRSYMFGGPWHLMNQLDALTPDQLAFARSEIAIYKGMRGIIRNGKVFHMTPAPDVGRIDAIESAYLGANAVAVVTREGGDADHITIKFRGLTAAAAYQVHFATDSRTMSMSGQQLATDGVWVNLPDAKCSEIVYADRQ